MAQGYNDTMFVTVYIRDGQPTIRVTGKKKGKEFIVEGVYGGGTDSPDTVAQWLLDADLLGAVDTVLSGEYKIEWKVVPLIDEDGTPYTKNEIVSLVHKPL